LGSEQLPVCLGLNVGMHEGRIVRTREREIKGMAAPKRLKKRGGTKSDDLHRRPRIEKAAVASVLNRSHILAAKIADELRNKTPEHFFDELWLADIYHSLEHVADVLSTVNGSQAQHPQRQK
jgi:hypothetical protein